MPLPSVKQRSEIDAAVHAAVTAVLHPSAAATSSSSATPIVSGLRGLCVYYALAGAEVAEKVCNQRYVVSTGSLAIANGPDGTGFGYRTKAHGGTSGEFHMWCARDDGANGVEVFDLASRAYETLASELGVAGPLKPIPTPLWCYQAELAPTYGVRLTADHALSAAMVPALRVSQAKIVGEIVTHAMDILVPPPHSAAEGTP